MADDRWRPRPHALVRVVPDESEVSPPGTWQVLAHGPSAPTAWWLMPISDEAVVWATENAPITVSRCIEVPGKRLRQHRTYADSQA
jgi:hypothetical protein